MASCSKLTCGKTIDNERRPLEVPTSENYLKNDIISFTGGIDAEEIKKNLIEKMFGHDYNNVIGKDKIIYKGIKNLFETIQCNKETCTQIWASCPKSQESENSTGDDEADDQVGGGKALARSRLGAVVRQVPCGKLKHYAEKELNSTAYMLKVITESTIIDKGKGQIVFEITAGHDLTGIWENDKENINIKEIRYNGQPVESKTEKGKLIMGFGPSASGKSFMAEKIINIMCETDETFPHIFFNIDGGEYRKYSAVYQTVVKAIEDYASGETKNICYIGINNLSKSINTENIKKKITDYLLGEKNRDNKLQINLYVPDTLNSCSLSSKSIFNLGLTHGCMEKISKYLRITNGYAEWIALMIYQHTGNCPLPEQYKCEGTKINGTKREKCESKKYNDGGFLKTNYRLAKNRGNKFLDPKTYEPEMKPKYMFRIHNPAQVGKKTRLYDLTPNIDSEFIKKFKRVLESKDIHYFNGKRERVEAEPDIDTDFDPAFDPQGFNTENKFYNPHPLEETNDELFNKEYFVENLPGVFRKTIVGRPSETMRRGTIAGLEEETLTENPLYEEGDDAESPSLFNEGDNADTQSGDYGFLEKEEEAGGGRRKTKRRKHHKKTQKHKKYKKIKTRKYKRRVKTFRNKK